MLKFYSGFEINDQTGNALTQKEMTTLHYDKITSLQVNSDFIKDRQSFYPSSVGVLFFYVYSIFLCFWKSFYKLKKNLKFLILTHFSS